jgi:DNA repair and recombination RAD54-like protein
MCKKVIVACPTSLIGNWDNEINKWLPGGLIRTLPLEPGPKVKQNIEGFLGHWPSSPQVLIVSYETFRTHHKKFCQPGACDLLICDEAHRLKNDQTQTSKCLAALPCRRRMLLSGTPMQNDLFEFFSMVEFINPTVLKDAAHFRKHFERPVLNGREPDASESQREKGEARSVELSAIVNQFILRRTNELLSAHLPPKLVQIVCCKLSPLQRMVYEHFVNNVVSQKLLDVARKAAGEKSSAGTSTLGCILSLKKLCNHPKLIYDAMNGYDSAAASSSSAFKECEYLFPESFSSGRGNRAEFSELVEYSGKFAVLDRLLYYLRTNTKDRIVLVSNYTQTLDLMTQLCRTRGWPCIRLDGSCSGESDV